MVAAVLYQLLDFAAYPAWRDSWVAIDNPARDRLSTTRRILEATGARPGMRIVDVGAGGGYFSFKFASLVGPTGRVIATDRDWHMVVRLWFSQLLRGTENLTVRYADADSVDLPPTSADAILMVNVYAFDRCQTARNRSYLAGVARALRPGGRFVMENDFVHTRTWVPVHGRRLECSIASLEQIVASAAPDLELVSREEVRFAGYRLAADESPGYLLVFRRSRD
jgi:SAM-dependent methyltransferase